MQAIGAPRRGPNAFALAAIALAGFLFSLTPLAERLDNAILDAQWRLLRKLETRPAPDDVILVGVDEASLAALPEPPPLWHEALGRALSRVAGAQPRAIAFDLPLPERSFDAVRKGLDQALFTGLVDAARAAPLVAVLGIDPATRGARPIHTPFLAVLEEKRLGLGLAATDDDGVARRFTLLVPTEDGGFPTLTGRLCRELRRECSEGLIDWGLGEPILAVPLKNVLAMGDEALFARLFRDKIVLFGQTQRFVDRVSVPWNLAAWEAGGADSPGVLVHAQILRTALARAPAEASRPMALVLVTLSALLWVGRRPGLLLVTLSLTLLAAFAASTGLLRAGYQVPLGAVSFTLLLAWIARAVVEWRRHSLSNIPQAH
jgi:CHASE2 domain-containing sensor protein